MYPQKRPFKSRIYLLSFIAGYSITDLRVRVRLHYTRWVASVSTQQKALANLVVAWHAECIKWFTARNQLTQNVFIGYYASVPFSPYFCSFAVGRRTVSRWWRLQAGIRGYWKQQPIIVHFRVAVKMPSPSPHASQPVIILLFLKINIHHSTILFVSIHLRAHSMVFYFVFQIGWRTLNAENSNRIFTFDFKWNGNIRPHSDSHQIQPFHSHAHKMNLTVFCCCCLLHSRTFPFYLSHIVSVCCIPSERVKYYFGWCEFYGEIKTRINAIGRWPFIHIAICFHFGSSNRAKCPGSCA